MKDLFYKIALVFARRKLAKHKENFLASIEIYLSDRGKKCTRIEKRVQNLVIKHLVVGDLSTARIVLLSGYKTPDRLFSLDKRFFPLDLNRQKKKSLISALIQIFLILVLAGLALFAGLWLDNFLEISKAIQISIVLILCYLAFAVSVGFPAYVNFSQAGALTVMTTLAERDRSRDTAYVYLDHFGETLVGMDVLMNQFPSLVKRHLIVLDNLGSGDTVLIASNEGAEQFAAFFSDLKVQPINAQQEPNTPLYQLENGIYISTGCLTPEGKFFVENVATNKNKCIDYMLLEMITNKIKEMIEKLKR